MEKKLKKVQRGAAVGFVLLKIMRILLIIAAIVLIAALVFLAVVNENDLLQDVVQDGKLVFDLKELELGQVGIEKVPDIGGLIQDGVLTLDLRDAKLSLLMLLGAALLALIAVYVLLLVAGNLFVFWVCGIALGYFIGSEFIRRLALPLDKVNLSLNLSSLLVALIFFFLARLFSFGKAQGEALKSLQTTQAATIAAPAQAPVYQDPVIPVAPVVPAAPAAPAPEPVIEPIPEPAAEPVVEAAAPEEEIAHEEPEV